MLPDVKRAKSISLGDVLGKCKRLAFLVSFLSRSEKPTQQMSVFLHFECQ